MKTQICLCAVSQFMLIKPSVSKKSQLRPTEVTPPGVRSHPGWPGLRPSPVQAVALPRGVLSAL